MRLSLVFPAWTTVFGDMKKVAKGASTFPPLNLAYLASIAEKEGHVVQLIDGEADGLTAGEVVDRVVEFKPSLIGFTATTPMFHIVVQYAMKLKKIINVPIIVGGPHVTYFQENVIHDSIDYLAVGDWEGIFGRFLHALENKEDISSVPGLIFRKDGKVMHGKGRIIPKLSLDELPFPARHLLNLDLYTVGTLQGRKKYTSILTMTGCPFKCAFCSSVVYGTSVRFRSINNVIAEVKHVINYHNINHFYFIDSTLTLKRSYIEELCDAIEREGLKFTWEGSTRANLVDEKLIARMKECGLIRISFGLETADPKIGKIIMKGVNLESYVKANELTNKYGIETINSVMIGLPGDTRETIIKTISFVRNARSIKHSTLSIAIPYPGSAMYDWAVRGEYGLKLLTDDFSQYQRYNNAVMSVNGIQPEELIKLQKTGLLKIYLVPWRIIPVLKRFGFAALLKPFFSALFTRMKR